MKTFAWVFKIPYMAIKYSVYLLIALILIFVGCIGYVFLKIDRRENNEVADPDPIIEEALEEDLNKLPRGDFRDLSPLKQADECFAMFENLKGNCVPKVPVEHWWRERKRKNV